MFHDIVKAICARTEHVNASEASETVRAARDVARETLGRIAYDAYCESSGGKSHVSGDSLPNWESLPTAIRQSWITAGSTAASAALTSVSRMVSE